jgi:hypothetical protein
MQRWLGVSKRGWLTLAITWPLRAKVLNKDHSGAAQMYGIVSRVYHRFIGCLV